MTDRGASGSKLKRAVGVLDLTALGIGAVIGTGIFVIIGEAIGTSGPGDRALLRARRGHLHLLGALLRRARVRDPVSGSAYTYAYATMGELVAFIIGWDLILEYGLSIAAIAVGWGGYLNALLDSLFSIEIPKELANPPGQMGGEFNAPAVFLVLAVTGGADRRDQGERPLEHDHGRHQARGPALLHRRRRHRLRQLQLRAVRAQRVHRDGRRRGADLLRLHRLRRGLDRERGEQGPGPRPAAARSSARC